MGEIMCDAQGEVLSTRKVFSQVSFVTFRNSNQPFLVVSYLWREPCVDDRAYDVARFFRLVAARFKLVALVLCTGVLFWIIDW